MPTCTNGHPHSFAESITFPVGSYAYINKKAEAFSSFSVGSTHTWQPTPYLVLNQTSKWRFQASFKRSFACLGEGEWNERTNQTDLCWSQNHYWMWTSRLCGCNRHIMTTIPQKLFQHKKTQAEKPTLLSNQQLSDRIEAFSAFERLRENLAGLGCIRHTCLVRHVCLPFATALMKMFIQCNRTAVHSTLLASAMAPMSCKHGHSAAHFVHFQIFF